MAPGGLRLAVLRTSRGGLQRPRRRCRAAPNPSSGNCCPTPTRLVKMHSSCRWPSARSQPCSTKRGADAMLFDTPAKTNPIDQLKVIGKPTDRIDGPLKTTGHATYAYEHHEPVPNAAYGYVVGASIAKGRIDSMDVAEAKAAPGVIT